MRARTAERCEAVRRLRAECKGLRTIAKELDIDRKSARRFAIAASPADVITAATSRSRMIDEFVPHLLTRWNAGHTDIAAPITELRELGYRGSRNEVWTAGEALRVSRAGTTVDRAGHTLLFASCGS
ncbi:hypothetical protein AB0B25_29530 [Nocardia sp. NPDC049190]|uniref:hypothetical protein n=1 Tax=Nocardia sp. NPDC049190 TaxID=3155650 RepID=UPI0033C8CFB9